MRPLFRFSRRKPFQALQRHRLKRVPRFRNPFLEQKKGRSFKFFRVINIVLAIGIATAAYFFLFTNFYTITSVEVRGNKAIAANDILDIVDEYLRGKTWYALPKSNLFIFSRNDIVRRIQSKYVVHNLIISKVLPNAII